MDLKAIIDQLRREHAQLTEAIAAIERMGTSSGKRRGRPPAWLAAMRQNAGSGPPKRRGRPPKNKDGVKD